MCDKIKRGRHAEKSTVQLSVRILTDDAEELNLMASELGITRAEMLRQAIAHGVTSIKSKLAKVKSEALRSALNG